ncbi:hypothetical protein KAR52_02495 [Candidatus Pacearchaeota archaeon]|nr:hypothetical protein [Candidatus Pacearchaeota archaeon]
MEHEFTLGEMEHPCTCLRQLLEAEIPMLRKEISKNKYYLSQKEHHDVGWKVAEKDFVEHYLDTWATGFKAAYCNYICPAKDSCIVKKL